MHRVVGSTLGIVTTAFLLSFPSLDWQLVVWVVILQFLAELYVLRNYSLALLFITPLALLMVQLANPQPAGPMLQARVLETAIGVVIGIPFEVACLLGCGVITGMGTAINTAGVRVGDYVAVFGCGGVGLNGIQGAKIAGARKIIGIDLQPSKLELAKKFGATDVINPKEEDLVERVMEITSGYGVHHAFEMIGLLPTLEQAMSILGMDGTAYVVGMQKPENRLSVELFHDLLMKRKAVKGVYMGSTNSHIDIPIYADMYTQGRLNLDDLVSKRIKLEDINEAYEELAGGQVARAVITFD